jgi:glycosyltransferase involved in cell wall biosynthesis
LSKFIEGNKLNVILEGKRLDVENYYKWADIYFQPSVSEGFSNSILEAMSYSLPVFASDTGAAREVLGIDSVIFDPKNSRQIEDLLHEIYNKKIDLRRLSSHNNKISQHYEIEHCLGMHIEIFSKALKVFK